VIECGYQAVIHGADGGLLAEQHFLNLHQWLEAVGSEGGVYSQAVSRARRGKIFIKEFGPGTSNWWSETMLYSGSGLNSTAWASPSSMSSISLGVRSKRAFEEKRGEALMFW